MQFHTEFHCDPFQDRTPREQIIGSINDQAYVGGVWGPASRKFFRECLALANGDLDIDLYHWSSTRFSRAWFDSLPTPPAADAMLALALTDSERSPRRTITYSPDTIASPAYSPD